MRCAVRFVVALVLALAQPARAADEVVPWDRAEQFFGQEVTVEGVVTAVHCSKLACLLGFDPSFNRFTVVVQAKDFGRMPPDALDARYTGRRVRVKGTVVDRDRKPEIVVDDPDNLKLAESKEERQERVDARIENQERAPERFEQMLARVEALMDRLAEAQDRMDAAVEALEVQSHALMVAAANPPVVQVPMVEGPAGPAPRPSWEVMRSVKRGMSAGDVRRLIGEPTSVIPGGNGWSTWLYEDGRSVAFDGRGRAQSLNGFPGS